MPAAESNRPTWEQVLAEVEADLAQRAEHQRADLARAAAATDPSGRRSAEFWLTAPPSGLMLAGPALPDPADMPPVPAELADRIQELRAEVSRLQEELRQELALVRGQYAVVSSWRVRAQSLVSAETPVSRLVDLSA